MLQLKKISKSYKTGDFEQKALDDVSLEFRKNEFVAILGPSGSGKTTLLNIVGGLDRYDKGDLIINGKSTREFKDKDWDAYRNNCIGFVFQSYNLITHMSVLDNIEMGMTLSGVSKKTRHRKALDVLERVGLKEHAHKKPNQLSGGQMQRVAIARALANDPDVILADEPTGALDSTTSVQIMELIKDIAKDKLVIMVTHNAALANEYASRIVEVKDGEIVNDTNPITEKDSSKEKFNIKKTAMSYITALKLSFNNIRTKKGRTLLTAFASSIGIIGIALILSLSNGFDLQIDKFETETLSSFPISIMPGSLELDEETMTAISESTKGTFPDEKYVYPKKINLQEEMHYNKFTQEYMDYLEDMDPDAVAGISYTRMSLMMMNLLVKNNSKVSAVNIMQAFGMNALATIPKKLDKDQEGYLEKTYELLAGEYPEKATDVILVVNANNEVNSTLFTSLGFEEKEKYDFSELVGLELQVPLNNDCYIPLEMNGKTIYVANPAITKLYDNKNNIKLEIVGIVRIKEDLKIGVLMEGIVVQDELADLIYERNKDSNLIKAQKKSDYFVLTGQEFTGNSGTGTTDTSSLIATKEDALAYLGASNLPMLISIYPRDFDSKDTITKYLDAYNEGKAEEDQITYIDYAATMVDLSGGIMDAITVVLIAFSAVSLIVSSIMIGIITYISVLERTKEIGVLRSLGARKKDITRVFNAETFIVGITSGIIGVLIARLLLFPANMIIENLTDLPNVAQINPLHIVALLIVSTTLTVIGGMIPAKLASHKDPVEALRTE